MAIRLSMSMSFPARVDRKADVVLCHRGGGSGRADQVIEFGELQLLADRPRIREPMHQRSEPPREARGLPNSPQARRRVGVEAVFAAFGIALDQRSRQVVDIGGGQV